MDNDISKTGKREIEEGDFVWVPREPYRPFSYYTMTDGHLLEIIGSLVVLILQLKK